MARRITLMQSVNMLLVFDLLSVVLGLFSAVALYVTYLRTSRAEWSIYVAFVSSLIVAAYQATSFAIELNLRRRFKRSSAANCAADELDASPNVPPLDASETPSLVNAQSVSESTTKRLDLLRGQSERSKQR